MVDACEARLLTPLGLRTLAPGEPGYAPRYSPDAKSILFWDKQALWTMDIQGNNLRQVARDLFEPIAGVWSKSKQPAAFFAKSFLMRMGRS